MNHSSRNQPEFFATLPRLGPSFRAEFVEETAGVGLDGVLAHKKFFRNLAVAQAVGNQLKYFQFAFGNRQRFQLLLVQGKGSRRYEDLSFHNPLALNDDLFFAGNFESQPDAY